MSESKKRTFKDRFLSTIWLWALVIAAFWVDTPWLYLVMFLTLTCYGLFEFFRLVPDSGYRRFRLQAFLVTIGYGILTFSPVLFGLDPKWLDHADELAIAALLIVISADRIRFGLDGYRMIDEIAMTVFGFIYITILFGFTPKILFLDTAGEGSGRFYVIYLLVITKFTDMGAYLVGSLIGRHKMIPKISPGKTWQGFGGAILFGLLGSFGCYFLFGERIALITPLHAAIIGVLLTLVAVLGDLVESILKRSLEAKDSGQVMPGIGGILDLIDSILLTGPVLFVYLVFLLD